MPYLGVVAAPLPSNISNITAIQIAMTLVVCRVAIETVHTPADVAADSAIITPVAVFVCTTVGVRAMVIAYTPVAGNVHRTTKARLIIVTIGILPTDICAITTLIIIIVADAVFPLRTFIIGLTAVFRSACGSIVFVFAFYGLIAME
jgi:hypothetical protein